VRTNSHFPLPNDIEFSGERKRVRCNEGLGRLETALYVLCGRLAPCSDVGNRLAVGFEH
jgi:hypothetical protein